MSRGRRRAAYLHRDSVNGALRGRRGARMAALTSGGAIPELGDYRVVAEPDDTFVGTVNEDFTAYGLLDHRHTPEIEQATGAQVLFTPHLAPMTRGILATCYARPTAATTRAPGTSTCLSTAR